ncbi:MAG: PDZ domain-containing protein [Anaerolineae bacterium]|nr:PDZ domain-containing protein [Anaerolineae bacterium]
MSRIQKRWLMMLFAVLLVMIGFASADSAQSQPGISERPYLGVRLQNTDNGVVVSAVVADSPAEAAGLQVDDRIDSINGEDISSAHALVEAVSALKPGDPVTLGVTRGEETVTIEATLAEQPVQERMVVISDVSIRYDGENKTWIVEKLGEDNPLYEAGLREGDVITAIDGEVREPQDLADLFGASAMRDTHTLTVERDGESIAIEIDGSTLPLFLLFGIHGGDVTLPNPMVPRIVIPPVEPGRGRIPGPLGIWEAQNGRLGVMFDVLTPEIAADMNVDVSEGAVIRELVPGSPAESAGLQVNDIVTAVNGEPVDAERTLRDRIFAYEPGDTVTLDVVRGTETLQLEVTLDAPEPLGPMPSGMRLPAIPTPPPVPAVPATNL